MIDIIYGIAIAIIGLAIIWIRKGSIKYVEEKAKNLATKEDIGEITNTVEEVKKTHENYSHAWKEIFEKEYSILEGVWESAWKLQSTVRKLKPNTDFRDKNKSADQINRERWDDYFKAKNEYIDSIILTRPFIPPNIYENCIEIEKQL